MRLRRLAVAGCVGALSVGAGACGGGSDNSGVGGTNASNTVDVYSSLPLHGASRNETRAMVDGMKLALGKAGGKAGDFAIHYQSLDDSTVQSGGWDPGQTAQNAREAAQDSNAIAYIGDLDSGASAISIPILNLASVPQVSPASTYVGLTTSEPGSVKGEPQKYYPTGKRTYVRIVPRDTFQAAALVTLMKGDGCRKVAIVNDKDVYGAGLARLVETKAEDLNLDIVSDQGIDKSQPNFRSYAQSIKSQGADCFLFAGVTANGAVQIAKDVAAAIPNVKLYGPDGTCESGFTNPADKGIPASIGKQYQCTVATPDLESLPGGRGFLKAFKAKYGNARPDPYAIYGYEAMKLVIDTIKGLGDNGDDKDAMIQALFATKDRQSVLGTYSFDQNGDTTLTDYGVYKVGSDGNPTFERAIKAQG